MEETTSSEVTSQQENLAACCERANTPPAYGPDHGPVLPQT